MVTFVAYVTEDDSTVRVECNGCELQIHFSDNQLSYFNCQYRCTQFEMGNSRGMGWREFCFA